MKRRARYNKGFNRAIYIHGRKHLFEAKPLSPYAQGYETAARLNKLIWRMNHEEKEKEIL